MSNASGLDPATARATPPVAALDDRACNGVDLEVFFPKHSGDAGRAVAICKLCPHRQVCLDWAIETGQGYGVWGATTAEERHKMRRRAA